MGNYLSFRVRRQFFGRCLPVVIAAAFFGVFPTVVVFSAAVVFPAVVVFPAAVGAAFFGEGPDEA